MNKIFWGFGSIFIFAVLLTVISSQYSEQLVATPLQLPLATGNSDTTTLAPSTHQQPLIIHSGIEVHHFQIEVADNDAERSQGLMHRKTLAIDKGMLFLYQPPRSVSMWMKNTYIPLDIIFIAPNGKIIRIAKDTQPHSLQLIPSDHKVQAVLEITSGLTNLLNIKKGDPVQHPLITAERLIQ